MLPKEIREAQAAATPRYSAAVQQEETSGDTPPECEVVAAQSPLAAAREMLRGRYPIRYRDFWEGDLRAMLSEVMVPGVRVLDVGSGVQPTIRPEDRPEDCRYVGLDISASELAAAEPGSYDETIVTDLVTHMPELEDRFDVIVSFQVLEHIAPLSIAVENMRSYLKPGGTMVHKFSGGRSLPALIHRLVPFRLAVWIDSTLRGRDPSSMFPTHYDQCTYLGLERMLAPFSTRRIVSQQTGALYFTFLRPLQALYVLFEDMVARRDMRDFAVYYIVSATR